MPPPPVMPAPPALSPLPMKCPLPPSSPRTPWWEKPLLRLAGALRSLAVALDDKMADVGRATGRDSPTTEDLSEVDLCHVSIDMLQDTADLLAEIATLPDLNHLTTVYSSEYFADLAQSARRAADDADADCPGETVESLAWQIFHFSASLVGTGQAAEARADSADLRHVTRLAVDIVLKATGRTCEDRPAFGVCLLVSEDPSPTPTGESKPSRMQSH